jgi:ArsR family transcriptional regulator
MSEILLSLDDENLGKVADVLGSRSAKRILEVLSEGEMSAGDLADKLGMRLNTVSYNVDKLLKVGLIEKSSHLWSVKGRRVVMYRASNRKIVISPRKSVKNFLLGWVGVGVVALGLRGLSFGKDVAQESVRVVNDFVPEAEILAVNAGVSDGVLGTADVSFWLSLAGWEWFLFGVWVSVLGFFVY